MGRDVRAFREMWRIMYTNEDEQNHQVQNTKSKSMNSNQKAKADAMASTLWFYFNVCPS